MPVIVTTPPTVEPVTLAEARAHLRLNSAPNFAAGLADQTVTLPATGSYTLTIVGAGSVAIAAGTATGTGWATATAAAPKTVILATIGTVTLDVTGIVTAITLSLVLEEDTMVSSLIVSAREQAEAITRRALITQTLKLYLDSFPAEIEVPRPALQSVTAIKYLDSDGTEQTLAADQYRVDISSLPARVVPAYGCTWPTIRGDIGGVNIEYVAGYGLAADVPQSIKQWMLLVIGAMWEIREQIVTGQITDLTGFADALLAPHRVITF